MPEVAALFAALGEPTRLSLVERLGDGQARSISAIARGLPISRQALTKHLKVLERAHLITRARDAQWRPCRLAAAPLKEVAEWVEHYRRFWEESFDRLDEYLRAIQKKDRKTAAKASKTK